MFKNYFLIVWRNLYRHPVFALINVAGLTLGLGFAILVLQYVGHANSYDRQYSNAEQTYRIVNGERWIRGRENYRVYMPSTLLQLKEIAPEIRYAATYTAPDDYEVEIEGQEFEDDLSFVNEDFFRIFDVPFLRGDPETALAIPFNLVLTESLARKYFNSIDVIGRSLLLEGEKNFTVAGVIADFPVNTHLENILFASHGSITRRGFATDASAAPYQYRLHVYLQFARGNPQASIARINELYHREVQQLVDAGNARRALGRGVTEPETLTLQALTDIHLSQAQHEVRRVEGRQASVTKITYGMTAALAAGLVVMILGISCFNYIYMSIARASQRSKEIAMRKVNGASRRQLFIQFICESLVITLIATALALLLAWILRPLVAGFTGVDEASFGFLNLRFLLTLLGLVLATAVLAGLYPALILSNISPLQALTGSGGALGKVKLRRFLIVCQFAVAAMLLMVTFFIFKQLAWLDSADMGFESGNIVVVSPESRIRRGNFDSNATSLRNELLSHPEITAMSVSERGPLRFSGVAGMEVKRYGQGDDQFVELNALGVDDYFVDLYKPRLQAGRFLDIRTYPSDLTQTENRTVASGGGVVLTQAALDMLSISDPRQVVGEQLDVKVLGFRGWRGSDEVHKFTVVGVIDNINFGPGSAALYPHVLLTQPSFPGFFAVRTTGNNNQQVMRHITDAFSNTFGGMSVRASFLSELYKRQNSMLKKLGSGFSVVTLISVVISCLGLYAIAAFTVQRRTKEVGVRKAIGASSASIVRLLIWDFTKPVLISIALALPVAVLAIYSALQYMPNHSPLGVAIFIEVVLVVLLIAWLTVSSHTLRTAVDSPTNALRYE